MVKQASLLLLVVALVSGLSGCCTEQKCRDAFQLTECTRAECAQKYPPIQGPEGPDVILGPGGGNVLAWKVDQSNATSSGASVFDTCLLRKDFIGTAIVNDTFKYLRNGESTTRKAEEIELISSGTGIQLKIKRGSSGALDWWIKNKTTGKSCTLKMGPVPSPITAVPTEFIGLTYGGGADVFKEVVDDKPAERIEFKVQY
jgi:hypothetical protein